MDDAAQNDVMDGAEEAETEPGTGTDKATEPVEKTDWKANSRKWESRAKANAAAAKELEALKESQKTELQKANERAEKAEKALADAVSQREHDEVLLKVAAKYGLPTNVLHGDDEEEIVASAEAVKAAIKAAYPQYPGDKGGKQLPGSITKEQIMQIKDSSKRKQAMLENIELFR